MSNSNTRAIGSSAPHHRFWPTRLPHRITPPATSLWHNLAVSALRYPDKPALVFFDQVLTYRELFAQAERLAVRFVAERVSLDPGGNLEARARELRRQALMRHVDQGAALLLAHHRQDQAETLMLRLLRGAGVRGLAAMAEHQQWQGQEIRRPLLALDRTTLEAAAAAWQLSWIDDPANDQLHFDRNFLRHRLLPLLRQRWPQADARLHRSAAVLAEQAALLDELAQADFLACDGIGDSLDLAGWRALSAPRRRNLLYGWLRRRGIRPPSAEKIARIDAELVAAGADRQPEIVWPEGELVRHRDRLWLLSPGARRPLTGSHDWWPLQQPSCQFDGLSVRLVEQGELCLRRTELPLQIRAAAGGERLFWRGHHREVSELWRAAAIPPWRRRRLPLFFVDGELVAVAAIGVADGWSAPSGEAAFQLRIEDSAL